METNDKRYLAHTAEDGRVQSIQEHLRGTARLCAEFASFFGASQYGELAGMAHDIGKYSKEFQNRLLNNGEKPDHSTAGAFECARLGQIYAAFAVAGHHGGLPDGGTQGSNSEKGTFLARMEKARKGKLPDYTAWSGETELPAAGKMFLVDPLDITFFTRMLFSCLVDADYLDTEEFMLGHGPERGVKTDMESLCQKLREYISPWFPPKTPLNEQRCAILEQCMKKGGEEKSGLFTLTVPTGGGKTVASLAFALEHARANGLRRVIYVIPYTSIIEQTARVFREILGEENVLEYHSGVLYDPDEGDSAPMKTALAAENWDIPVVVTTAVQFFESLYSCRPSQCRKLHNIAGSVVIFDEAQMLPVNYLKPCVSVISQLVARYNVSAVLCTATQPALDGIFAKYLPGRDAAEICPESFFKKELFQRVTFRRAGALEQTELAERLNSEHQALCIVNTRREAQEIFQALDPNGAYHLSTLMCPAHRRKALDEIRRRLKEDLPCRVVSTSLIEAGVDVDFPTVYREEAGIDSILQAAGRCNREGGRSAEDSVVTVFRGSSAVPRVLAIPVAAGREVLERFEDISEKDAIREYFSVLLDLKGEKALDYKGILPMLKERFCPFRTVSEAFQLIESPVYTVYIPIGEGGALVRRLKNGERSRALFRRLGQYGVSVYDRHFKELYQSGALSILDDGSAVLEDVGLYSDRTGLAMEAGGSALFIE